MGEIALYPSHPQSAVHIPQRLYLATGGGAGEDDARVLRAVGAGQNIPADRGRGGDLTLQEHIGETTPRPGHAGKGFSGFHPFHLGVAHHMQLVNRPMSVPNKIPIKNVLRMCVSMYRGCAKEIVSQLIVASIWCSNPC
jgi:hypothetical protein